jgi:hypothetical protein
VEFAQKAIERWKDRLKEQCITASSGDTPLRGVKFRDCDIDSMQTLSVVCGNCFDIDFTFSQTVCRYDRIYISAACPLVRIRNFLSLLSPREGVLIVPVEECNDLVRITRHGDTAFQLKKLSKVSYASLIDWPFPTGEEELLTEQVLRAENWDMVLTVPATIDVSKVIVIIASSLLLMFIVLTQQDRFTQSIRLPPVRWAPIRIRHAQFPTSFHTAAKLLLLACSAKDNQPHSPPRSKRLVCSWLPTHLLFVILSFATRYRSHDSISFSNVMMFYFCTQTVVGIVYEQGLV